MSTKLNAEELANKMFPVYGEDIEYGPSWREAAKRTIREVAQPLADERDELREALEWIKGHGIPAMARDDYRRGYMDARDDMAEHARAILAKYPKQP